MVQLSAYFIPCYRDELLTHFDYLVCLGVIDIDASDCEVTPSCCRFCHIGTANSPVLHPPAGKPPARTFAYGWRVAANAVRGTP